MPAIFLKPTATNIEATIPTAMPQNTAGRLSLALTLSKYIKTKTAISIASNPSLKRIKKELAKAVSDVSIIKKLIISFIITVNENDYQYQYVAQNTTKKCIGGLVIYVYA